MSAAEEEVGIVSERFLISGARESERYHPPASDATLTPPRTQYGATLGKLERREPLRYAGFAILRKSQQRCLKDCGPEGRGFEPCRSHRGDCVEDYRCYAWPPLRS